MAQSANAVHCDNVTGACTRITQRVVNGNTGTHEWSCFLGGQFVGNRRQRSRRCNHVLSVSTIELDAGDLPINAHCKVTTPALFADETMSTMPSNTNALPFGPCCDVRA